MASSPPSKKAKNQATTESPSSQSHSQWDFTEEEFDKEVQTLLAAFEVKDENVIFCSDFAYDLTAPALIAQSKYLGEGHERGNWRDLLQRRVQGRVDTWKRYDRQQKEKKDAVVLPGPVDPGCDPTLDVSKYGFYVETDAELSESGGARSFFLEQCSIPASSDGGDFVLKLIIPDFFDERDQDPPFQYYWEEGSRNGPAPNGRENDTRAYSQWCEGIRHYPVIPPIRIYAIDKAAGFQADFFDNSFGRLWLYNTFSKYDDEQILPMVIRSEHEKDDGKKAFAPFSKKGNSISRVIHIFNECKNMDTHKKFYGNMGIALYRWGTELRVYAKVEMPVKGAGDFFGEFLQFS